MTSIRKRSWLGPDGEQRTAWQVDYRDQAGKRRSKQFARKKDAEAWRVGAEHEISIGIHTPESMSPTVATAAEQWIWGLRAVKDEPLEPTTIAAYEQHVRLHIVPKCGGRKLASLSAPFIRSVLDQWLAELSRPMAVRVLRTFKAVLGDAVERGALAHNPSAGVKVGKARKRDQVEPPSKADLRAILGAADGADDLKGRAILELAIFSGMRASELRGLAWSSVDLKGGAVEVRQRADAKGEIGAPKSKAGFRTIGLPARAVRLLKQWKLACPSHPANLVFPSDKGRPLSHRVLMVNHVAPIIAAAKVAPVGLHAFRHAAASLWIEQGLNAKLVQTMMGHSSVQVTFDVYGHLFERADQVARNASAIERALFSDAT